MLKSSMEQNHADKSPCSISKQGEILSDCCVCLQDVDFIVDKLHFKGHIGKNCKKFCHSDNFPCFKSLNSVVSEQKLFWLRKY